MAKSSRDLYFELLADFDEVSRKLMHYQSNAYHWHDKVPYYEKAWAENDVKLHDELASTVAEESVTIADPNLKAPRRQHISKELEG